MLYNCSFIYVIRAVASAGLQQSPVHILNRASVHHGQGQDKKLLRWRVNNFTMNYLSYIKCFIAYSQTWYSNITSIIFVTNLDTMLQKITRKKLYMVIFSSSSFYKGYNNDNKGSINVESFRNGFKNWQSMWERFQPSNL